MKYLESYKTNQRNKINLNSKLVDFKNKFVIGQYMIFTCEEIDWHIHSKTFRETGDILYLGKIGNIEHSKEMRHGDVIVNTYLSVLLLDFIMEIDLPLIQFSTKNFYLEDDKNFKNIIYKSNSRLEAQNKFDELKNQAPYSDWEIKKQARKFNI